MTFGGAGVALPSSGLARAVRCDWSPLDTLLAERVGRGHFDGMGLIVGRAETILHEACFGTSGPTTAVQVASAGKWLAAAVIAAVVDTGALRWSDPVRRFLPQFRDMKGRATLRQLLSHTAGFPDDRSGAAVRDSFQTLAESVRHIAGLPAVCEPGTQFQYGGLAMQVAGRMAELADGRDFNTIFLERLAQPLAMAHSGFVPVSQAPGFSPMLGGGLFTTSGDYARFLMMIAQDGRFRGTRVLSRAAIQAMQADQVRGATVKAGEYVELARRVQRRDVYGLGLWREEVGADGRPTLISSPGWAGAYPWIDKRYGVWGLVLAKANSPAAGYDSFLGSALYAPLVRGILDATRLVHLPLQD